jgi:peptidoglycan/xylan/chitin deacetylase (PgdA/CDA1 family)/O-antigen ligase
VTQRASSVAAVVSGYAGRTLRRGGVPSAGTLLLALSAFWLLLLAMLQGGWPLPALATMGGVAAAYLFGTLGSRWRAWISPVAVFGLAILLLLASPVSTLTGGPGEGPFEYANARAAFFLIGGTAGLMLFYRTRGRLAWVTLGLTAVMMLVPTLADARTASVMSAFVVVAALLGPERLRGRIVVMASAGMAAIILLAAVWVAARQGPGGLVSALGPRRVALWGEALELSATNPWVGVGPGRFAEVSEVALRDEDARWAHNDFLEVGAETGIIGLSLLLTVFGWGFLRLWGSSGPPEQVILAATVLGSLGVMATTDYMLHFPAIPMSVAALVGGATGSSGGARSGRASPVARRAVKVAALPWGFVSRRRPGDTVILLYHRVGSGDREIDVPVDLFREHMAMLAHRDDVRKLDHALDGSGGVVVTFDDGFVDFHENALPILVRYRIPAVIFLATGLVESGQDGLSWAQLEEAVGTGLVTVGGHTHSHADLSRLNEAEIEHELRLSKTLIEEKLGVPCRHFAYPWAIGSSRAERVVRRHFESASLHAWRTNRRGRTDRYRLGRTPILRADGSLFFRAKLRGMLDAEAIAYRVLGRGPWAKG